MARSVKVRVPGTSANCGPGFDSIGVACTIYNDLELTLLPDEHLEITVEGEGADNIPLNSRNMVWRAIQLLLKRAHRFREYPGAAIRMVNRIPLSRGLGSSAAAIVAGLKAANVLLENPFSRRELLQLATDMEGHPDNVAPALLGGFTVSLLHQRRAESFSFLPRLPLKLVVAIPSFHLSTRLARNALPKTVPLADAVFNVSRAALLVGALIKGNIRFLRHAFDDALHQPYRAELIPGMYDVMEAAKKAGALGAAMSGAGPCLMAYTLGEEAAIGDAMVHAFRAHEIEARCLLLDIERRGAHIVKEEH